jgi:hypothetical protein
MQSKIFPINGFKTANLKIFGDFLLDNETGMLFPKSTQCLMSEDGLIHFYKESDAIGHIDSMKTMIDLFKGSLLIKKQVKLVSKSTGQFKNVGRLFYLATNKPANVKNTECHLFDYIYWCPFESGKEECYTMDFLKGFDKVWE